MTSERDCEKRGSAAACPKLGDELKKHDAAAEMSFPLPPRAEAILASKREA